MTSWTIEEWMLLNMQLDIHHQVICCMPRHHSRCVIDNSACGVHFSHWDDTIFAGYEPYCAERICYQNTEVVFCSLWHRSTIPADALICFAPWQILNWNEPRTNCCADVQHRTLSPLFNMKNWIKKYLEYFPWFVDFWYYIVMIIVFIILVAVFL